MVNDRKTNINNLTIVWQGQSWSAIAPDGVVLGRFKEKWDAVQFAKGNTKYIMTGKTPNNYADKDFIEFSDYIYNRKQKNIVEEEQNQHHEIIAETSQSYESKRKNDYHTQARNNSKSLFIIGLLILSLVVGGFSIFAVPQNRSEIDPPILETQVDKRLLGSQAQEPVIQTTPIPEISTTEAQKEINFLGLGILGLIVVFVLMILKEMFEDGCLAGLAGVFFLIIGMALCNQIGILSRFLDWVF